MLVFRFLEGKFHSKRTKFCWEQLWRYCHSECMGINVSFKSEWFLNSQWMWNISVDQSENLFQRDGGLHRIRSSISNKNVYSTMQSGQCTPRECKGPSKSSNSAVTLLLEWNFTRRNSESKQIDRNPVCFSTKRQFVFLKYILQYYYSSWIYVCLGSALERFEINKRRFCLGERCINIKFQ